MLQRYDAEQEESQRKFQAAIAGAELKDATKPNGRKRTMTKQDIMRNYAR